MSDVLLGALNVPYTPGGVVSADPGTLPTTSDIITLPTDSTAPSFGGGTVSLPKADVPAAELPTPEPTETEAPEAAETPKKKNLLIWGIAGIALAYLLLRKK